MAITLEIVKERLLALIRYKPGMEELELYSIGDMYDNELMNMIYDALRQLEEENYIYSYEPPLPHTSEHFTGIAPDKRFYPISLSLLWKKYSKWEFVP